MGELNKAQEIVARTYADGDYAHVKSLEECYNDIGDTLFTFLMVELADKEGCDTIAEASRRISTAVDQLQEIIGELENACEPLCRKCEREYRDGGDGYDGMCPSCADKAEEQPPS